MNIATFFSKLVAENRNFNADYTVDLAASEQITSITSIVVSPVDVLLTVTPTIVSGGKSVNINAVGGTANTSYTITFTATTSLAQVIIRSYGLNVLSGSSSFPLDSESSIPTLAGSLYAGDSVLGNTVFNFPAGSVLTGGTLGWSLLDNQGILHASGFGSYAITTADNGSVLVAGTAVISTPSELDASTGSLSYQLRWEFSHSSLSQTVPSYESIQVLSKYETPLGVEDTIEIVGTTAVLNCILDRTYDSVSIEIYDSSDTLLVGPVSVKTTETLIAGGVVYSYSYSTSGLTADLIPKVVAFKYSDGFSGAPVNRSFGNLYLVTPSILSASEDLRTFINRTNTSIVGSADMIFTQSALLTFLRMGRDYFNMVFQITNFTMTRASGGIRDGWLMCSSIRALRSQFIAEGEQAFDYQGQAISLNVDRTQYYDSLASNLESQLEMYNKFKAQLTKRGITAGNGDLTNTAYGRGNVAAVGLNLTPLSGYSMGTNRMLRPY